MKREQVVPVVLRKIAVAEVRLGVVVRVPADIADAELPEIGARGEDVEEEANGDFDRFV